MRIRSIKPEFWRSDDIAQLPRDDRLLFIGIWSYVDDNGVGRDQASLIAADLFAHDLSIDPTETLRRVNMGLQRLYMDGLIHRYRGPYNGKDRDFLQVANWDSHQRIQNPGKARYPRSDAQGVTIPETLHRSSVEPTEILGPGAGEQGSRGAGTSSSEVAAATPDPERPDPNAREDIKGIYDHLHQRLTENENKTPDTPPKAWLDAARLLLDRDKRPEAEIHRVIDWCQQDGFWKTNILSLPKLREKYDQLRLKAQEPQRPTGPPQQFRSAAERRYAQGATLVADELAQWQEQQRQKEITR
ncbi:hypothetical protein [Nesterenkonia sandarakina]|uniref:Uncharacterized protein n=1 Tax=Nesterenkonia sandarakina TaxID=272918 RepID=A0A2T0YIY3_9MICC|nr:hypothetical protein [Nesterenkonia sandarakina]PRZ15166.1 hypothetical protein BCL67_10987 [Nesterenkonia sandarakina]